MKKVLNEGNQIHNFISSSGSGTVINYGSGSGFLTSYGSSSTSQKVTVPTVPVPVPQRCVIFTFPYKNLHRTSLASTLEGYLEIAHLEWNGRADKTLLQDLVEPEER
jgi:hypothetical protein